MLGSTTNPTQSVKIGYNNSKKKQFNRLGQQVQLLSCAKHITISNGIGANYEGS